MMKSKSILAAALFAAAFSAQAAFDGDGEASRFQTTTGSATQMRAELAKPIGPGQHAQVEMTDFPVNGGHQRSRAAVRAELAEARRLGLLHSGEAGVAYPTAAQEQAILAAGRQAASMVTGIQTKD
jgi:hypothetical protein